jgi:2-methylcitrate dehydratase PrpD
MTTASQALARFAAGIKLSDVPPEVVERAKDCIIDTYAAATFGSQFPWSQMVADYARRYGSGGPCSIIGATGGKVHAPSAALANGVFAHAFEQDSVRDPGVGTHPGATLLPAVLAAAEETGASGQAVTEAFIAGVEVMFRIGCATHHSPEKIGFHSPGLTGVFGAAVAVGRIFGLDAGQLAHAIGISGSLSSGLLAFSKSKDGAMVKRLHLGRSAESGVLAARLAGEGYTGPETILEGKFGFLDAYCNKEDVEPALMTKDLGTTWEVMRICLKRYPAHINAHVPVQIVRELIAEHRFGPADLDHVTIEGSERFMTHHNIKEPGDLMQAQYSIPFCVAVALHRDPDDPKSLDATALEDSSIRGVCRAIDMRQRTDGNKSVRAARVTIRLKDGREFSKHAETYKGTPSNPLSRSELHRKFMLLTDSLGKDRAQSIFEKLDRIEAQKSLVFA